jgi:Na+/H+ antiporter NhaD/arsenite permease-like protein
VITAVVVFFLVYLGMLLGGFPRLALDRTGVALLGAIVLIAAGGMPLHDAASAVDAPTLALLFGLMIVSAQFRLGGFYTRLTRQLAARDASPPALLALLVAAAGGLSALLANDIVCLAMAPVLVEVCARRGLAPVPFLLALACAANVGSAATLIGNPQNMLIGQTLGLSFAGYLLDGLVPALLGLVATWWIIQRQARDHWHAVTPVPDIHAPPSIAGRARREGSCWAASCSRSSSRRYPAITWRSPRRASCSPAAAWRRAGCWAWWTGSCSSSSSASSL